MLFAQPTAADDCKRFLTGERLDLSQRLPVIDMPETTGAQEARSLRA